MQNIVKVIAEKIKCLGHTSSYAGFKEKHRPACTYSFNNLFTVTHRISLQTVPCHTLMIMTVKQPALQ